MKKALQLLNLPAELPVAKPSSQSEYILTVNEGTNKGTNQGTVEFYERTATKNGKDRSNSNNSGKSIISDSV